jgi:hypothetical protein
VPTKCLALKRGKGSKKRIGGMGFLRARSFIILLKEISSTSIMPWGHSIRTNIHQNAAHVGCPWGVVQAKSLFYRMQLYGEFCFCGSQNSSPVAPLSLVPPALPDLIRFFCLFVFRPVVFNVGQDGVRSGAWFFSLPLPNWHLTTSEMMSFGGEC